MNCREFLLNLTEGRMMSAWMVREWLQGMTDKDRRESIVYVLGGLEASEQRSLLWLHLAPSVLDDFLSVGLELEVPEVVKLTGGYEGDEDEHVDRSYSLLLRLTRLINRTGVREERRWAMKYDLVEVENSLSLDPCGLMLLVKDEVQFVRFPSFPKETIDSIWNRD